MKQITSIQNSLIKNIIKLQEKSRERKKQNLFVVEGKRELSLALKGGYRITSLLFVPEMIDQNYLANFKGVEFIEISKEVYEKIAYRESTEGVIALVKTKKLALNTIILDENPLILVAESIEKPGNLGALLRTADAVNVDAVLVANPKADIYNPNVIRSSVGCLFTNQIGVGSSEEIIEFLKENNISIYSATLQNANEYTKEDFTNSCALVVGAEATGLSNSWRQQAAKTIYIPMEGEIDSMNVSVAAAILLFEAKRQRKVS